VTIDPESVRTALIAECRRDSYLLNYARRIQRDGRSPTSTPAMALGERKLVVLAIASRADLVLEYDTLSDLPKDVQSLGLAMSLNFAPVYLWRGPILAEVNAMTLPPHTIHREICPMPLMFWTFENALDQHDGREIYWVLLMATTDEWMNVYIGGSRGQVPFVNGGSVRYGTRYPDDQAAVNLTFILKCLAFLNSPYTVTERESPTRAERREWAHDNAGRPGPDVSVIKLRVPEKEMGSVSAGGTKGRHHHWWVRSHLRAQWYPKDQAHKVIWIPPHIRGDLDKPLLQHVYEVAR